MHCISSFTVLSTNQNVKIMKLFNDEVDDDLNGQNMDAAHNCAYNTIKLGIIIVAIILLICTLEKKCSAQSWGYENKGLYPNAASITLNRHNHALGIKYDYLFQNPVLHTIPLGISASFSQTIRPNLWMNSYRWERKYCIGYIITLPHAREQSTAHLMGTVDLVYNSHPRPWPNDGLLPGQTYADVATTTAVGLNLGIRIQLKHCTSFLRTDFINRWSYTEFGGGVSFSYHKQMWQ
jgi:hypothetical protein